MTIGALRALILLVPLIMTLLAWPRANAATKAGALVSFFWLLGGVFALHLVSDQWWAYRTQQAVLAGLPVDVWFGWALAWGPVPILFLRRLPLWVATVIIVWIEVLAMMLSDALINLHANWLVGEAFGVAVVLVPAMLLARWTAANTHLLGRVVLQLIGFGALALVVLPLSAVEATGQMVRWLEPQQPWFLPLSVLCMLPPLVAVHQFYRAGGTPFPWDPPHLLVTDGLYAWVRNPMQLFMCLAYAFAALAWHAPVLLLIPVAAVFFSMGIGDWHEQHTMHRLFGAPYAKYRQSVRSWLPFKKRSSR